MKLNLVGSQPLSGFSVTRYIFITYWPSHHVFYSSQALASVHVAYAFCSVHSAADVTSMHCVWVMVQCGCLFFSAQFVEFFMTTLSNVCYTVICCYCCCVELRWTVAGSADVKRFKSAVVAWTPSGDRDRCWSLGYFRRMETPACYWRLWPETSRCIYGMIELRLISLIELFLLMTVVEQERVQ